MSRLWSTCPLDCPAIPVGAFFGWMALTVWADAGPGVDAEAAGLGLGEAGLPRLGEGEGEGEAVEVGDEAGTVAWEKGGLGEGAGEDCWERGAAVQATIQTSRTAARRPTRCSDIPARIMCVRSWRGGQA